MKKLIFVLVALSFASITSTGFSCPCSGDGKAKPADSTAPEPTTEKKP